MKSRTKMPKNMSKRAAKRKPKRTVRRSKKAEEQRSTAIALLTEWAEKEVPVELMSGRSGLKLMGYLVKMEWDSEIEDFMFRTPFGIAVLVFPITHDDIRVDALLPNKPTVILDSSRFPDERIRIEAQPGYEPSAEQIEAVKQQFESWSSDGGNLIVTMGDNMRMTLCVCEISKAADDTFMLTDRQAKTVHVVFLRSSGIVNVAEGKNGTEVTLHNRHTNSFISIRQAPKGRTESPEEILARLPMPNRLVH